MRSKQYRINEIFYSLQGEGYWTGTPMVFVRFSACNLQCPFCDTEHRPYREMTAEEIVQEVLRLDGDAHCARVCLTGGEPLLQVDEELLQVLHPAGYCIHVETNGTRLAPEGIDWVTLSPKEDVPGLKGDGKVALEKADEVKLVFDGTMDGDRLDFWAGFPAAWHFLQPCDTGDLVRNRAVLAGTIDYVKAHGAKWRLSLQTHKLLGIR